MRDFLLIIIMIASIESCGHVKSINEKLFPMPPTEQPDTSPNPIGNPQTKDI